MAKFTQFEKGPFSATIIDAFKRVDSTSEMFNLLELIRVTVITEGHDEIIVAIRDSFSFPGATKYERYIRMAIDSLAEQKALAEQNSKNTVNSIELGNEMKKLQALFDDPQSGLMSWNEEVIDRMKSIHEMISRVIGK